MFTGQSVFTLGYWCCVCAVSLTMVHARGWAAEPPVAEVTNAALIPLPISAAEWQLGTLTLTGKLENITRVLIADDSSGSHLVKLLDQHWFAEGSILTLELPAVDKSASAWKLLLETAPESGQAADGRIIFSALDATIKGETAKLASNKGQHHISGWTSADEAIEWQYQPTRPGRYEVFFSYSMAATDEAESSATVSITLGDQELSSALEVTGGDGVVRTIRLGTAQLTTEGVTVRCGKAAGPTAINVKAITLVPVSEGQQTKQAADGRITLHAKDVTIHGVKVQYEPSPNKNTVGYWIHATDQVAWEFQASQSGRYELEVLQGCGAGQGGSEVEVQLAGETVRFTVEDTGHFQNFKPRTIGQLTIPSAGEYQLWVRPIKKAGVAVMDLRQVRLIPAQEEPDGSR